MTSRSNKRRQRPGIRLPIWALFILGIAFTAIFIGSSLWLFHTVQTMAASFEVSNPEFGTVTDPVPGAAITIDENNPEGESESLPILSADALKPWSGHDRVSILLLGIDQRCEETGPTHTDSMMVLTIDPVGLSAAMVSLPRDLWVEIPDIGLDRINQAHYFGELYELPGGGPQLAMETVEATLGVPLKYFVAVNFDAFVQFVDLIGGIDVDVPEAIDDPDYPDRCYGFDPFAIEPGFQHLDGENALKYARTRATFGGDVDRAARQQAVILAVRDQVLRLDKLTDLITQSPHIWQSLQENVRTNLTLDEAVQLALLMQNIPAASVQTAVIDYNYVYNETTPDGRQVLVPNRSAIRTLRDRLFTPPAIPTPVIDNLPTLMINEKARVALFNGTNVFGLAADTQAYLSQFNINVTEVGNADSSLYQSSQIIDYGQNPYTTQYLTQLMHIPPLNTSSGKSPEGDFDVLVIIGADWQVPGAD